MSKKVKVGLGVSVGVIVILIIGLLLITRNNYTEVQQQVISQFEDGIEKLEKAKEYAEKEDHQAKADYIDMAFDDFVSVCDITKDGDMYVVDVRKVGYIYYYEHQTSDKLTDIYFNYDFVFKADRKYNEEEWDEFINALEEEIDNYKLICREKNNR